MLSVFVLCGLPQEGEETRGFLTDVSNLPTRKNEKDGEGEQEVKIRKRIKGRTETEREKKE